MTVWLFFAFFAASDGFVSIPAGTLEQHRIEAFEMATQPVTNGRQMVDTYPEASLVRFKYRIERGPDIENAIAGGSWARSAAYLATGVRGAASPGIRHPDLGFRVVRAPAGSTHFERLPRRLIDAPRGGQAGYAAYFEWEP